MSNASQEGPTTLSPQMGQRLERMVSSAQMQRRKMERRWFDNNFFDDGYHFRYVSNKTGKIIDHTSKNFVSQERAIPRASRQIRGISNLMLASEPYPVIYPEMITMANYPEGLNDPRYQADLTQAKMIARRKGNWLTTEWNEEQDMISKIVEMLILSAKHSVSYLKIWGDDSKQRIHTVVRDAFDMYHYGNYKELKYLPFIAEGIPTPVAEIKSNPLFDEEKVAQLNPDNKFATSEIKEAYIRTRFGARANEDEQPTLILKEGFIKEYLSKDNLEFAKMIDAGGALDGKKPGDMIMRHTFEASGITLKDEYVDLDEYPYADFRYEPGPLYQTAQIERFIPQNKSLDVVMTRLENILNSMVIGVYQKRKGENYQVSNAAGGQIIEYETTPLQQMQMPGVPAYVFNFIELLNKFIDEQGASTSALNQLPNGVKSGIAIENVKSTEYANLKIPTIMLKKTLKAISERMFEVVDKQFTDPYTVYHMEDGDPDYFDIIGHKSLQKRLAIGAPMPANAIPIKKDTKVRIEIEPGLGLTMEGKKDTMEQIITFMIQLSNIPGVLSPEALQMVVKKFLDVYGFGSTQEFMEALDSGNTLGQLNESQIQQVKVALAETLKDTGAVGPEAQNQQVDTTKVGVLEALKESGIIDKMNVGQQPTQNAPKPPTISINYKDMPPEAQAQALAKDGIQVTPQSALQTTIANKPVPTARGGASSNGSIQGR